MSLFDIFRPAGVPADPPPAPQRRGAPIRKERKIEAGEVTRLTASWNAANLPADEEIKRALERTRARSRDLAYNNEYARKYLQMVQAHIVGPGGFTLQALAMEGRQPDRLARDAIERAWWQWGQPGSCEATGRHGFADFCRLVVETVVRDGEALVMRRRGAGNAFGYQLKLLEIDRLPVQKNEVLKSGNRVVMGVELNDDGRAVAYWLNLGALDTSGTNVAATLTRVPAEDVLHIYRPMRPEQHRGLPWMTPVMTGLKMLAGYEEAAVVAARVGAAKMGFYTSPDGQADPLADDQVDGEFYTDAEAGVFSVLPPGYDFKAFDPDYPHQGYADFVKTRLRSIASGLGVAYHTLANDLADVNYSSARAGTLEERDNWIVLQNWLIDSFLRPVYLDWLAEALARGAILLPNGSALPVAKQDKFAAHEWQGRRWTWVDPLKDIEASVLAIKSGLASPQTIAAQQGLDLQDVIDSIATANQWAAAAGLAPYAAPEPGPAPAPAPAPQPDPAMEKLAMAAMARMAEPPAVPPAPTFVVHNHQGATEVRNDVHVPAPVVNVEPAAVQVDVAAPAVSIEPAAVEVRVEAIMPEQAAPVVEVNVETPDEIRIAALPERVTTSRVERDGAGNIIRTEQVEADAAPAPEAE